MLLTHSIPVIVTQWNAHGDHPDVVSMELTPELQDYAPHNDYANYGFHWGTHAIVSKGDWVVTVPALNLSRVYKDAEYQAVIHPQLTPRT